MAPANVPASRTLFALQPDNSDRKIARAIEISLFPLNSQQLYYRNDFKEYNLYSI